MSTSSTNTSFWRRHLDKMGVGSLLLLASVWLSSGIAAGLGIAGLVIASILNVWLRVRQLKAG